MCTLKANTQTTPKVDSPLTQELLHLSRAARAPRLRTMREFAEQEVIIPSGRFQSLRYRCDVQPYSGLLFDAIDSGRWSRVVITGPSQSGKTLTGFNIPILWHLFERKEGVICGLPHLDMAADKWRVDLLPAIERTKYRELLPRRGKGARGGASITSVTFLNGTELRFMTGGGGDKQRAGYQSRVLMITETDGMDESGGGSREADKITQLETRLRSWSDQYIEYMECTVSIEEGRTWREYTAGTEGRIALRCPACGEYSVPTNTPADRELLSGWQDAETVIQARKLSRFHCPACGVAWSEADRVLANREALLVHAGQSIEAGKVIGKPRETDTLGFRWSAVNNLLMTAGDIGVDEWRGARDPDEDNAERKLAQFVWALPYESPFVESRPLNSEALQRRVTKLVRGLVPVDTTHLTVGVDLGKFLAHYIVVAWQGERGAERSHIVDYGVLEIDTDRLGVERATLICLRELRELCEAGWVQEEHNKPRRPEQVWIDSGYSETTAVVYTFCRESMARANEEAGRISYRPVKGFGAAQRRHYIVPTKTGPIVVHIGEQYHLTLIKKDRVHLVHVNADYWKTYVHARLGIPQDAAGAMTVHYAPPHEHMKLSKHLTAEHPERQFVKDRGVVLLWKRDRAANHWLDALYLSAAAGHLAGVRLVEARAAAPASEPERASRVPIETKAGGWKIGR